MCRDTPSGTAAEAFLTQAAKHAPERGRVRTRRLYFLRPLTGHFAFTARRFPVQSRHGPGHSAALAAAEGFTHGILGSGSIVNDCHIVAYRKAGFNPVAIASRRREHAAAVAARPGLVKVCDTPEQLLDEPSIEVLDIAVPPDAQLGLIQAACERKTVRGILAQKPLGVNYAEAVQAVHACEAAGIALAVNQNMR